MDYISVLICQTEQTIHLRSVHLTEYEVELNKNVRKCFPNLSITAYYLNSGYEDSTCIFVVITREFFKNRTVFYLYSYLSEWPST